MMVSIVSVSVVTTRNPSAQVMPNTGRSSNVARKADLELRSGLGATSDITIDIDIPHYGTFNLPLYPHNNNHRHNQDKCVDLSDIHKQIQYFTI